MVNKKEAFLSKMINLDLNHKWKLLSGWVHSDELSYKPFFKDKDISLLGLLKCRKEIINKMSKF